MTKVIERMKITRVTMENRVIIGDYGVGDCIDEIWVLVSRAGLLLKGEPPAFRVMFGEKNEMAVHLSIVP